MIKLITLFSFLILIIFTSCKSDQKQNTDATNDSLTTYNNKPTYQVDTRYTITPPKPDYTGDHIQKYPNGVVKFSGFFRFGERHGQWLAFYENGTLWSECFYDKGKKQGASNVFYANGKPQYKGWHKNDLRDSLWFFYDTLGKEIDKRAFKNNEETGLVN